LESLPLLQGHFHPNSGGIEQKLLGKVQDGLNVDLVQLGVFEPQFGKGKFFFELVPLLIVCLPVDCLLVNECVSQVLFPFAQFLDLPLTSGEEVGVLTPGFHSGLHIASRGPGSGGEQVIEANLAKRGVSAKVDSAAGKVTVQTQEGTATYAGGQGTKIPDGFPKDIYVPAGATVLATVTTPGGFNLTLESSDAAADVAQAFKDKMTAAGWQESMSMNQGTINMLGYQKDGRAVQLVISRDSNKTHITLTVSTGQTTSRE
jgi:hypothetical protein